jgi:hypothetical protein
VIAHCPGGGHVLPSTHLCHQGLAGSAARAALAIALAEPTPSSLSSATLLVSSVFPHGGPDVPSAGGSSCGSPALAVILGIVAQYTYPRTHRQRVVTTPTRPCVPPRSHGGRVAQGGGRCVIAQVVPRRCCGRSRSSPSSLFFVRRRNADALQHTPLRWLRTVRARGRVDRVITPDARLRENSIAARALLAGRNAYWWPSAPVLGGDRHRAPPPVGHRRRHLQNDRLRSARRFITINYVGSSVGAPPPTPTLHPPPAWASCRLRGHPALSAIAPPSWRGFQPLRRRLQRIAKPLRVRSAPTP